MMDMERHVDLYKGWLLVVMWKVGAGYVSTIADDFDTYLVCERAGSVKDAFDFAKHEVDRMEALAGVEA